MKSSLDQLSLKEKQALALIYSTDGFKALKRVHELEVNNLGVDALGAANMEEVKRLAGRAIQSKYLIKLIEDCYKQTEKG